VKQTRRELISASLAAAALAGAPSLRAQVRRPPVVIARGGAAGGWPAGSRGAYDQAVIEGADFLESAVLPTKDGVLIAREDNDLSADTDVAARSEFAGRRATRVIDGATREGWFCEDFTAAEIKSLTLLPPGRGDRRPAAQKAERPAILSFDDLMALARSGSVRTARVVGVCARIVHPRYFASLEAPVEPLLGEAVRDQGYNSPAAAMLLAGADRASLKTLAEHTRARRVLLAEGGSDLGDLKGLTGLYGIGVPAGAVIDLAEVKTLPSSFLADKAHGAGLAIHAWAGGLGEAFPPPSHRPPPEHKNR
jgi:glycerophosphoryl diester phosphodiesterase